MDPEVGQWRDDVAAVISEHYSDFRIFVLDPRIPSYEPHLFHGIDDTDFKTVFDWELRGVQLADQVVFWFAGGSRAPISLIELGISHLRGDRIIVGCDPTFWRFAYIREFCERFQIPFKTQVADLGVLARYRL